MKIVLLFIYFVVTLLPLFIEAKNKRFDLFNLKNIFLIYLLLQIGVYESIYTIFDIEESWYRPSDYYVNYAISLAIVGTICFQISYYVTPKVKFKKHGVVHHIEKQRAVLYSLLLIVFCYLMFLYLLFINDGLFNFLDNLQSWRSVGMTGQGIYIFPATSMLSISVILFLTKYADKEKLNNKTKLKLVLMLLFALVPPLVIGFRGLVITPIIHFMIVFRESLVTGISRVKTIVFVILITVAYTAYGIYRQWGEINTDKPSLFDGLRIFIEVRPELALDVFLRSKGTDVVGTVISQLDVTGQYNGFMDSLIEAISILAPRAMVDKPDPLSVQFSMIFFDRSGGFSPTLIGELYWMGGAIGVVIGMFLFGLIAKIVYSYYMDNRSNMYLRLGYALFFVQFALMAESLQGNLNAMVLIFSFYVVLLFAIRFRFSTK
jgi:oligosaccharide repeat unit polymerase